MRPEAKDAFDDCNRHRIVVQGNRDRSWFNGIAASDFSDDRFRPRSYARKDRSRPSDDRSYRIDRNYPSL